MSYDLMVFNHSKVPCEFETLRQWFDVHMENDVLPDKPPAIFGAFLEKLKKLFPPINNCPEGSLEYACEYEVHEDFVYMCFGYSAAQKAHDIVKRQARIDNLGFWEVSQSFDSTFPVTLPVDKWPMMIEAEWIKYGKCFVHSFAEVQKVLMQMKTAKRSCACLTDRFGNYIQAGGYKDTLIVETRRYTDAITYQHMRADLQNEDLAADTAVSINGFNIMAPKSQIFSINQVCLLFQEFAEEIAPEDFEVFWKEMEL